MITAQTSAPAPADAPGAAPERAALAGAIDAQAHRMDQLSAAIVRATAQVTWSGRAAERFRARAAERARECLQMAVALRASAERVHAAEVAPLAPQPGRAGHPGHARAEAQLSGHAQVVAGISGLVGSRLGGEAIGAGPALRPEPGPEPGPGREPGR
ncbi:small-conductance mechanosensitive channel [Catenulispora sp. MAP5-51]|uniref:hypothetical protein n=1 Tax=Catenulispora sp. MAP5-51 TaxID=3156298 RepID=UPI00351405C4